MKVVSDPSRIKECEALALEMLEYGTEFKLDWARQARWTIAPVEAGVALGDDAGIARVVTALKGAGHDTALAIVTEDLGKAPNLELRRWFKAKVFGVPTDDSQDLVPCCLFAVGPADFHELRRMLGGFRFLLTDQKYSWAMSSNEWYELFAGPQELVEAMLGVSVAKAREEFLKFASGLAHGNPDDVFLKVARRYATCS